MKKMSIR